MLQWVNGVSASNTTKWNKDAIVLYPLKVVPS